jgi:Putative prokaryotic signal transducing protein
MGGKLNKNRYISLTLLIMDDKIVTFESYSDPMLAEIILGRLQANGIDCFIADNNTIGANPLFNNTLGGIKIKVFEHDVEKCRQILAEVEDLPVDELPEQQEVTCPYCNSNNVRYGSATEQKTTWLGSLVSLVTLTYPFIARKAWHCFNCGRDFE